MAAPVRRGDLRLSKHHGAGNDFLVVLDPDDERPLSAGEVRALCDRRRGVGADGVLRATRGGGGADLTMELRNADGGAAEMSGNGIRCLVQAAVDAGLVSEGDVTVRTAGGLRAVRYETGAAPGAGYGWVAMGRAVLGQELAPDDPVGARWPVGTRWGRRVDVGNPHVVLFGSPVDDDVVRRVGAAVERSVPGGVNVEFVWAGPEPGELTLRVWERGVGETLACGTGACAAAAAAHDRGEIGVLARVHVPGGPLDVELTDDGVVLAGPTQKVADITVAGAVLAALVDALDGGTAAPAATEVATRP